MQSSFLRGSLEHRRRMGMSEAAIVDDIARSIAEGDFVEVRGNRRIKLRGLGGLRRVASAFAKEDPQLADVLLHRGIGC